MQTSSVSEPLPSEQQERGGDDDRRRSGRQHSASGRTP